MRCAAAMSDIYAAVKETAAASALGDTERYAALVAPVSGAAADEACARIDAARARLQGTERAPAAQLSLDLPRQ